MKWLCSTIILTIGIPGAGKTRWVNKYLKTHPLTYVISTDKLREELTGIEQCVNPSQNEWIHNEARKRAKAILEDPLSKGGMGPEIIIDSTNVEKEEWEKYRKLGSTLLLAKIFETTPSQAMEYQKNRERFVPLEIVEMKWKQLQTNKQFIPLYFNMIL